MTMQQRELPGTAPGVREALRSLLESAGGRDRLWQLADDEVTEALSDVARVRQLLDIAEVALVREGLGRGLPGETAWTERDWVSRAEGQRCPDPSGRHTSQVVRMARAGTPMAGRSAHVAREAVTGVVAAFESGELPLGKADQLARFHDQVAPVAVEEDLAEALETLTDGASDEVRLTGTEGGARERVGGLTERQLASAISQAGRLLRPEKEQEDEDRRAKAARSLTRSEGPAGMTRYRVLLDEEGAAVLDAALAALSGPVTGPNGERDPRPAAQRRADALVELIRRGVSSPGEASTNEKAQVIITMDLDDLREQTNAAGVTFTGQVLAPSVVRRMACDAGIIPTVLGSKGEVLDMGRRVRFFTPGQRRAIWLRDQGCTFPGCTMPPQWTDVHHVDWWCHQGPTDVSNGALLCERHHTRVHQLGANATVTGTGVTWHL